jgi:polar amino acid transport system permease protein
MILIKATPLLFLLGVEDIVYWARELGGTKTAKFTSYPHGDWRVWYFLGLLIFYLAFTRISEALIDALTRILSRGTATLGSDLQRQVGR